jgi:hypothetical protein
MQLRPAIQAISALLIHAAGATKNPQEYERIVRIHAL